MSDTPAEAARSFCNQPFGAMSDFILSTSNAATGCIATRDYATTGCIVNNNLSQLVTGQPPAVVCSPLMGTRRPVFHEDLGRFLKGLRAAKGWGQSRAVAIAEQRKLKALTRQRLRGLEEGRTKKPDPQLLRDIATLYGMPYSELLARVVESSYLVTVEVGALIDGQGSTRASKESPTESAERDRLQKKTPEQGVPAVTQPPVSPFVGLVAEMARTVEALHDKDAAAWFRDQVYQLMTAATNGDFPSSDENPEDTGS